MSEQGEAKIMETSGYEVKLSRFLPVPPALVYQVWTRDEHLRHWSHAKGLTIVALATDARPGGAWEVTMRAPDGEDFPARGLFRETVENERLVYTHAWLEDDGTMTPETVVTVTFTPEKNGTRLDFHQAPFAVLARRDGHVQGWTEALDQLEAYLPGLQR